jgi:hypothetical protein
MRRPNRISPPHRFRRARTHHFTVLIFENEEERTAKVIDDVLSPTPWDERRRLCA